MLIDIPPKRRAWEAERAAEHDAAERALERARFGWFLLALLMVGLGYLPMAFAPHVEDQALGEALFWLGILLADVGPQVVLWIAVKSEEP